MTRNDLFLINGRLHTQDDSYPRATALAIRGGRVQPVGDDDEIRALAGPGARVVDLEGQLALPGTTDAHLHYYDWALGLRRVPLTGVRSLPYLKRRLAQRAREIPPGQWVLGQGWNESRCPVADPNPMLGIHAAVTRQMRDGTPPGGWYPEQRLTAAEAVWGFTMGAALASGRQAHLGSITPGKLADLMVLDRDILALAETDPTEIARAQVAMTIFDGRIVHEG